MQQAGDRGDALSTAPSTPPRFSGCAWRWCPGPVKGPDFLCITARRFVEAHPEGGPARAYSAHHDQSEEFRTHPTGHPGHAGGQDYAETKAWVQVKRVFITNVKGTFLGMSESEEASKRR